jgi:hypothetical protein
MDLTLIEKYWIKLCTKLIAVISHDNVEMIAVEVQGKDPKFTWEIIGIYRAPNEDMRFIEGLAARTDYLGKSTTRSIIEGDLNLPSAD